MGISLTGPGVTVYGPAYLYVNNGGADGLVRSFVMDDNTDQGSYYLADLGYGDAFRTTAFINMAGPSQTFEPGGGPANITANTFTGNGTLFDLTFDPAMTTYKALYVNGTKAYTASGQRSIEYFRVTLPAGWTRVISPHAGHGGPSDWGGVGSLFNSNQTNTAQDHSNPLGNFDEFGTFRTNMNIYNAAGTKVANLRFQQFNNGGADAVFGGGGTPCFVKGAKIKMADGSLRNVEDISAGDWVETYDHGPREVIWSGQRRYREVELEQIEKLRPVRIPEGAIGNTKTVLYSPLHQVMLTSDQADLLFGTGSEVMVTAKNLVNAGVAFMDEACDDITYCHFMFDDHELVQSDGMWTESFNPGVEARKALAPDARKEVVTIFPELENMETSGFTNIRPKLNKKEVSVLFSNVE